MNQPTIQNPPNDLSRESLSANRELIINLDETGSYRVMPNANSIRLGAVLMSSQNDRISVITQSGGFHLSTPNASYIADRILVKPSVDQHIEIVAVAVGKRFVPTAEIFQTAA